MGPRTSRFLLNRRQKPWLQKLLWDKPAAPIQDPRRISDLLDVSTVSGQPLNSDLPRKISRHNTQLQEL